MFIADVLRYDIEAVPSILRLLNNRGAIGWREFWPRDFTEEDILPALEELVSQGLVQPLEVDESTRELRRVERPVNVRAEASELWFLLTKRGWDAWDEWEPPPSPAGEG